MLDIFSSSEAKKSLNSGNHLKTQQSKYKDLPMQERKPLASFLMIPEGIGFETKDNDEKIIMFLRKHGITNLGWILMGALLYTFPSLISLTTFLEGIPDNFRFVFFLIWYLISTAFVLESFLTWFFNVYIITDERIIDIDFYNLIYKEVSDANIDKIQDVTYKMGGVVRTLFNYGDIEIQTASEVPNFEFIAVPYPDKVVKVLQDLRVEEQQEVIEGRVR